MAVARAEAAEAGAEAVGGRGLRPAGAERRAHRLLLGVCIAFALISVALVPLDLPLGWDEIVYASRFAPFAPDGPGSPAVPFSAPRTRGVPFLIAPVASWSGSTVLLRCWLVLLAALALYLGFRPWLRVLHRPAGAAVAAGLYGSLWFALFYASAAMPNHYTAMAATTAVGLFLRRGILRERINSLVYAGIGAAVALATLMRPNDGVAVAVPLVLAAALVPRWRSPGRVLAVAGGVLAGALPWIVEAHARFGGVRERLADASEVQGGLRPSLASSLRHQLTALDGPLLCRPCTGDRIQSSALEWWLVLPPLVALGLGALHRRVRHRRGDRDARARLAGAWLAVAVALAAALPYALLVPYAAPRFLLPAHALLALPAALGLLALFGRARAARWPRIATAALALAVAGHPAAQLPVTGSNVRIQSGARGDWERIAGVLRAQGVHAPCAVDGNTSVVPVAYVSGCASGGPRARVDALVLREKPPPSWARDWRRHPVPDTYAPGWVVHVRP